MTRPNMKQIMEYLPLVSRIYQFCTLKKTKKKPLAPVTYFGGDQEAKSMHSLSLSTSINVGRQLTSGCEVGQSF